MSLNILTTCFCILFEVPVAALPALDIFLDLLEFPLLLAGRLLLLILNALTIFDPNQSMEIDCTRSMRVNDMLDIVPVMASIWLRVT